MDWRQIAAIWLLSVAIVGLGITGVILWWHRDRPQHAAPRRLPVWNRGIMQARWEATGTAARRYMERRNAAASPEPPASDDHAAWQESLERADLIAAVRAWYATMNEVTTQAYYDAGGVGWR